MAHPAHTEISEEQLIAQLAKPPGDRPRYILFTGAGASVEANIPAGSGIIEDLLDQAWRGAGNTAKCPDLRKWAKKRLGWYRSWVQTPGDLSEYELVISQVKLTQEERSEYFKGLDDKANLVRARGNAALVRLVRLGLFRTILTTNFDNVLRRLYGGQGLAEFSAGSHIVAMDPCSAEARLIRLHGELTHGDPANSREETNAVGGERFDAVLRLLESHGLVIIGYSGADRRLMQDLFGRLENRHTRRGVFWCLLQGEPLSKPLEELIGRRLNDLKVVRIRNFTDFMRKLSKAAAHLRSATERDLRTTQITGLFLKIAEQQPSQDPFELHRAILDTLVRITGAQRGYLKVLDERAQSHGKLSATDRKGIAWFRKKAGTESQRVGNSLYCQYAPAAGALTTLGLFGNTLDTDENDGRLFRAILALVHRLER